MSDEATFTQQMEQDNRPSFTETFRQHIKHGGMEADADISVTVRSDTKDKAASIHRRLMELVKDAAPMRFNDVTTGPSTPCDTSERVSAPPVGSPYRCADFVPEISLGRNATDDDRRWLNDWQGTLSLSPPSGSYAKTVRAVEVYFPIGRYRESTSHGVMSRARCP